MCVCECEVPCVKSDSVCVCLRVVWNNLISCGCLESYFFISSQVPLLPPSYTPHRAIHQDGVRCLELLLKADHTYFKDHRGRTVLHLSAEAGCLSACQLILRLRADAVHDLDRMVSSAALSLSLSFTHLSCD